jgi:type I restriction enzyme, S subunit
MWRSYSKEPEKVPYCGKNTTLGAVISIKHGFAFKGEHFSDSGAHVVLTPGNFFDEGGFKHKAQEKYYTGPIPNDYILQKGDLIVAMTEQAEGLLGSAAFVPQGGIYLHNQRLGRVDPLNPELVDKGFLYYLFNWAGIRQQIRATCSGAKVRHTSPSRIYESKINLPPLATQKKIAVILSAYDDLIQNNERRIKILEDMAQNLYREWFVNFRFPDHAKVKMVDSPLGKIPQGWQIRTLSDICEFVNDGDWIETKDQSGSAYRLLQVSNIGLNHFVETGHMRFISEETFSRLHCQEVKTGNILISRMPTPIGRAWLVTTMPWRMITSVDVAIAGAKAETSNQYFLICYLNSDEHISNCEKRSTGTTRARIPRSSLCSIELLAPPFKYQQSFGSTVAPIFDLCASLRKKSDTLRQTRDLLLPKLIAGEVDVSELPVDSQCEG